MWVLVRTTSPRRFLRVPTICVLSKNKKIIKNFQLKKKIQFLKLKSLCLLHGQVFVMTLVLTYVLNFHTLSGDLKASIHIKVETALLHFINRINYVIKLNMNDMDMNDIIA